MESRLTLDRIPLMSSSATMEGDVLLQVCDKGLFGEAIQLLAEEDAEIKGVPLCQHALLRTNINGDKHKLGVIQSSYWVRESLMSNSLYKGDTYIVLRPQTHYVAIELTILAARKRLGMSYGYFNLIRLALGFLGIHIPGKEGEAYEVCSEYIAQSFEDGGFPVKPEPEDNVDFKPWDFLTTPTCPYRFSIVGKFVA